MPEAAPQIHAFELGPWATNCYLVSGPAGASGGGESRPTPCWIIDASFEPQPMLEALGELGWQPEALILTHAHLDHIAGGHAVRAAFPGVPVWIHGAEADWLSHPMLNLSASIGLPTTCPGPDRLLEHGDRLELPGLAGAWEVVHTPGHSPGGIGLYHAESATLFAGDALFAGSIGRTDFPGSDHTTLLGSIRDRLYALPGRTRVLPGHGPETTIERERRSNPFVRG